MGEYSIVEKADHIMTVRINRPDRLNALHPLANAELGQVFDDFATDDDCLLYTSPSPRDKRQSRMPSCA